jgi:hypothetical protein
MDDCVARRAIETGVAERTVAAVAATDVVAAVAVATDAVAAAPSGPFLGNFLASTRVQRRFHRFHWSWCVCQFRVISAGARCWWHLGLLLVEAVVDVCYGLRWTGVMDNGMGSRAVENAVAVRPKAAIAATHRPDAVAAVQAVVATASVSGAECRPRPFLSKFLASTRVKRRVRRIHWRWCVCQFRIIAAGARCWWHLGLLLIEAVIDMRYGLRCTGVMDDGVDSRAVETASAIRPDTAVAGTDNAAGIAAAVAVATDSIAVATDAVAAAPSSPLIGKFFASTCVKGRSHRFNWSKCVSQLRIFGVGACWLGHVRLLLVEAMIHVRYG